MFNEQNIFLIVSVAWLKLLFIKWHKYFQKQVLLLLKILPLFFLIRYYWTIKLFHLSHKTFPASISQCKYRYCGKVLTVNQINIHHLIMHVFPGVYFYNNRWYVILTLYSFHYNTLVLVESIKPMSLFILFRKKKTLNQTIQIMAFCSYSYLH